MKFAVIGHQDSWQQIMRFINRLRTEDNNDVLPLDKVKEVYSFFPPAKLFDVEAASNTSGLAEGMYIESFISPDELNGKHLWKNIGKVKAACVKAAKLGATIVSLGGFTSIVLESGSQSLSSINGTAFTTGNTLTAAFIADSIEKASVKWNKPLSNSRLMVIGSTGDIGSACVRYFSDKVKELLLNARQAGPLEEQKLRLKKSGINCRSSIDTISILPEADIVIAVASAMLPAHYTSLLPKDAIVCDAGYPKNLQLSPEQSDLKIYAGGMGFVEKGYRLTPSQYHELIYNFPISNISHGCILESIVLAMEKHAIPYSLGRGNITTQSMHSILKLGARHGIVTAPFFNSFGLLS